MPPRFEAVSQRENPRLAPGFPMFGFDQPIVVKSCTASKGCRTTSSSEGGGVEPDRANHRRSAMAAAFSQISAASVARIGTC